MSQRKDRVFQLNLAYPVHLRRTQPMTGSAISWGQAGGPTFGWWKPIGTSNQDYQVCRSIRQSLFCFPAGSFMTVNNDWETDKLCKDVTSREKHKIPSWYSPGSPLLSLIAQVIPLSILSSTGQCWQSGSMALGMGGRVVGGELQNILFPAKNRIHQNPII